MTTVDFVDSGGVVEQRVELDDETEYICLDNTMLGEYAVEADGKCRVLHQDGFDISLDSWERRDVELVAGNFVIVAQTGVEVPDWDEVYREFHSS